MSGGVDSSLAAALLKKGGYKAVGITFRMWPKEECGSSAGKACCSLEAVTRARMVAEDLGIPYYVVDFSGEFKKEVIDYFCAQYLKGLTPNPCVICNEKIKFGKLLEKAKSLGASHVASVLRRVSLFVSNDSGPVHIACAVGTPVIAIFGRSDRGLSPQRWGPTGKRDVVLHKDVGCIECLAHNCKKGFKCLEAITVDEVLAAAAKIL